METPSDMQEPLIFDFERKPCVTVPDLTDEHLKIAARNGVAAIDIETSGLDWKSERIGLCQIFVPNAPPALVKSKKNARPEKLLELLHDPSIRKIFHHAMFDLRFLGHHWGARPSNIACTKIASKLIDPDQARGHSLAMILDKYLNVKIDKSERQSDWLTWDLSDSQVAYASTDVIYLPQLLESLMMRLESKSRAGLAQRCFDHIPTRVELEINGFADVYQY